MKIITALSYKIMSFDTKTFYLLGLLFFMPLLGKAQNWTSYTTFDELQTMIIDAQGNKWFGTNGSGVFKFDGTTWTTYTKAQGLIANSVLAIAIDAQGNKWFGTPSGTSKFFEKVVSKTGEILAISLKIFPNPAYSNLHVSFKEQIGNNMAFIILDIYGRIVKKVSRSNAEQQLLESIDIKELSTGLYILSVYQKQRLLGSSQFVKM